MDRMRELLTSVPFFREEFRFMLCFDCWNNSGGMRRCPEGLSALLTELSSCAALRQQQTTGAEIFHPGPVGVLSQATNCKWSSMMSAVSLSQRELSRSALRSADWLIHTPFRGRRGS